jgi:hypothetical protein
MAATSITPPIYKAKPKTGIPKKSMWLIPLKQVSLYVVDLKALGVEKR